MKSSASFTIEQIETAIKRHGGDLGVVENLGYRVERIAGDPPYRFFVMAAGWVPLPVSVTIAAVGG